MLMICPECDLALQLPLLASGQMAHCPRCNADLARGGSRNTDLGLALLLTAAILLVLMNVFPLVEMRVQGGERAITLVGAVAELQVRGMTPLALLVLGTTLIGPALEILLLSLLLVPTRTSDRSAARMIGVIRRIRPWSMIDVFLLGVLVSLVKLAAFAEILPGPALFACAGLIMILTFLKALLPHEEVWEWSQLPGARA